jgi:DNA-binding LacI/PurR family transcriptional regulator
MIIDYKEILETPSSSLREGVANFFRYAIKTGRIQPGEQIPSSREIAKQLNTSYPNVHYGLSTLVKEGLISRDRKTGTIVNQREPQIKCVVIYTSNTTLDDLGPFQHSLIDLISRKLDNLGITPRLVIDNATHFGLTQIEDWARKGIIQGVVMPRDYQDETIKSTIRKLPIPVAFPGKRNSVRIDMRNLIDLAVNGLKNQGCKTVGTISTIKRFDNNGTEAEFYTRFKKKAEKSGMKCEYSWIKTPDPNNEYLKTSEMAMNYAFLACEQLLLLPNRPDGLFIFSDSLIAGTLLAIMKTGLSIPNDVKLVFHLNDEISIPIFKPCVIVGLSIAKVAEALINEITACFKGDKIKSTVVKYKSQNIY